MQQRAHNNNTRTIVRVTIVENRRLRRLRTRASHELTTARASGNQLVCTIRLRALQPHDDATVVEQDIQRWATPSARQSTLVLAFSVPIVTAGVGAARHAQRGFHNRGEVCVPLKPYRWTPSAPAAAAPCTCRRRAVTALLHTSAGALLLARALTKSTYFPT